MKKYKEPSFQERIAAAARARNGALAQLQAKPPVDEAVAAERSAKRLAKEAAAAEKRRLARLAADQIKAAKRARASEAAKLHIAAPKPELTEAERKAARDARYIARKNRTAS
ncbi:MAG: hypothetical protein J7494_03985 [Sphingobium sp.]|nr:hypothetical protein [Sphingobium sp.]